MANMIKLNDFNFAVGDTIAVHHKIKEGGKEKTQIFLGMVIAIKGSEPANKSFTVRKIGAGNIAVERIWPVLCPSISKIVVKKKGQVRRAKLYYLRSREGKNALKIKEEAHVKPEAKTGKIGRRTRPEKTA